METFVQDVRFALRLFARNPWFAALAVVALALGIGANTAVFSVVHAVLIKPLPFPNPDALVAVYDTQPFCSRCPASFPKYVDWRDQNAVFDAIGGSSPGSSILTGKGNPERIRTTRVTASLFRVFQLAPAAAGSPRTRTSPAALRSPSSATASGRSALPAIRTSWAKRSRSTASCASCDPRSGGSRTLPALVGSAFRRTGASDHRVYPRRARTSPFLFFRRTSIGCQPDGATLVGEYVST